MKLLFPQHDPQPALPASLKCSDGDVISLFRSFISL